jgi:hypothetical protein
MANPWSAKHIAGERAFADNEYEMGAAYEEARRADEKPILVCGNCQANAFFKPTVGRHVCPDCGAVHVSQDVWSVPSYPKHRR